ncbi:MAG TPA: NUDIX domain-containing protein [Streptosporangiaceae bacterium]|nr:NUDIX domain-containing protein [Streptosporangiaceae bacterium]
MTDATLAAGAAIWRSAADPGSGEAQVLLVHRPVYDDWSLPKGKSEPGEHILLTAVREVLEETCVRPVLGPRLPTVEYISWGRPKRVSYWAAFSAGLEAAPGQEIDAISWLPLAQARKRLAETHDDPVISALRPVETVPLILARHASAGRKADWPGDDFARPLDAAGKADARVLTGLLSCFAPAARVISSPALRCTQTVRPYAEESRGTVEAEACLIPYGRSPDFSSRTEQAGALRHLLSALVAQRRPVILCLHRENLPEVLAATCAALGAPASVPADPSLPKGGFWVAHAADGELAALERYEL